MAFDLSRFFKDANNNRQIISRALEEYKSTIPEADSTWPIQVVRVWDCISKSFADPNMNAGQILQSCGIRSNTIQGLFKWYTGRSIWSVIVYHRVELAKKLLESDELTVQEIAAGVGYADGVSLGRAFKRLVGLTPTRFKAGREDIWLN